MFQVDLIHLKFKKVQQVLVEDLDLSDLRKAVILINKNERNIAFDVSNQNSKVLIAAYDSKKNFLCRCVCIGTESFEFTQYVYGKYLLILPFSKKAFLALGEKTKLKLSHE